MSNLNNFNSNNLNDLQSVTADKIALDTFREILSNDDDNIFFQEVLMYKIRKIYVFSPSKALDFLSYYVKNSIVDPTFLFYNTELEYEALLLWKSSENSDISKRKFMSYWDEENPIPQWKLNILNMDQSLIKILLVYKSE